MDALAQGRATRKLELREGQGYLSEKGPPSRALRERGQPHQGLLSGPVSRSSRVLRQERLGLFEDVKRAGWLEGSAGLATWCSRAKGVGAYRACECEEATGELSRGVTGLTGCCVGWTVRGPGARLGATKFHAPSDPGPRRWGAPSTRGTWGSKDMLSGPKYRKWRRFKKLQCRDHRVDAGPWYTSALLDTGVETSCRGRGRKLRGVDAIYRDEDAVRSGGGGAGLLGTQCSVRLRPGRDAP